MAPVPNGKHERRKLGLGGNGRVLKDFLDPTPSHSGPGEAVEELPMVWIGRRFEDVGENTRGCAPRARG